MEKKENILVIDENKNDFKALDSLIGSEYTLILYDGIENLLKMTVQYEPVCIFLDYNLGLTCGMDILKEMKKLPDCRDISFIMLTNERDTHVIVECMKYDAANYLIKDDLDRETLIFAIERAKRDTHINWELRKRQEEILMLTRTDDLTGVYNRRYFKERIEEEIKRCKRGEGRFSLCVLDLDNFKNINDSFGHLIGDDVLRVVAKTIKNKIRCTDLLCRYGGDELVFALLEFNAADEKNVIEDHLKKCEAIQADIKEHVRAYLDNLEPAKKRRSGAPVFASASIGVSFYKDTAHGFYDLFDLADEALYKVKEVKKGEIAYYNHDNIVFWDGSLQYV